MGKRYLALCVMLALTVDNSFFGVQMTCSPKASARESRASCPSRLPPSSEGTATCDNACPFLSHLTPATERPVRLRRSYTNGGRSGSTAGARPEPVTVPRAVVALPLD
jgi:hypothetical protein